MVKKYKLVIEFNPETGELVHLSEYFSDMDTFKINVNGVLMDMPDEVQELLEDEGEDTLGIC